MNPWGIKDIESAWANNITSYFRRGEKLSDTGRGVQKYKMLPCQDLLGRVNSARIKLNPTVQDFWCLSFCWSPSKGCNCIIKLKIDKGTFKSAPHLWFQLVTTYIVLFQNCSIPGTSFWVDIVWLWACPSKCSICHLWLCHCLLLFSPQPKSIKQSRKTEIDQVVLHLWKM